MARPTRFSDLPGLIHTALVYYDFATDGGATGAISLPGVIPSGAVVLGGFYNVLTTFTTAGADAGTIALSIQSANDLKTAVAVSNGANPYDAPTVGDVVPDGTGSTAIKLTADRQVTVTIAGQAVTAGLLAVCLYYVMVPSAVNV
jgi:hypothetical protein